MELDSFMLSEISETEKEKYCVIPLICGILKKKKTKKTPTHRVECWLSGVGGWDNGETLVREQKLAVRRVL